MLVFITQNNQGQKDPIDPRQVIMAKKTTKKIFVYEILKKAIISGEIKPGEILNEAELAQKYSVGKMPTREALLLLTHENLLEAMPRVGYIVSQLTIKDLLEIYALRLILETEAVGLAAERITPEQLADLERNNRDEALLLEQNGSRMTSQAYQLNIEFHKIIAQASGNTRLKKMIVDLINDLERALYFDPFIADSTQHVEIIKSLKQRDNRRAQEAMKAHLTETRLRILKLL
jgi:DNA-binding GntR family transcriptional regulator